MTCTRLYRVQKHTI